MKMAVAVPAMTDSLFELVLENALLDFHHRSPKVRLELMLDSASVLTEQLRRGQLDAACLISDPLPASEWLVWDEVEMPIVVVANTRHPFAGKKRVRPEELAEQELILMEASAPYSMEFQRFLARSRLDCEPFLRLQSADTARRLVEREASFVSLLPLYMVQNAVREGRLCVLTCRSGGIGPHGENLRQATVGLPLQGCAAGGAYSGIAAGEAVLPWRMAFISSCLFA